MNRYQEIMEYVDVDPEAQARILRNIEKEAENQGKISASAGGFRRYGALAACLAVLLIGAISAGVLRIVKPIQNNEDPVAELSGEISSAGDLTEKSGILMKEIIPLVSYSEKTEYQMFSENGAEITYNMDDRTVVFQKSRGEIKEDDSAYDHTEELSLGRFTYTLRGSEDAYYSAQWSDGEFSYRMSFHPGQSRDEVLEAVSGVTKPDAGDLEAIHSRIEYPRKEEYLDWYQYATVSAPHGHSVYGFGSADHAGTAHTVLNGERVLVLAERKGYACVIVLSQNKGRWINKDYLVPDGETILGENA